MHKTVINLSQNCHITVIKLCDAASKGNIGRIRFLLASGVDINCSRIRTPLYWAAYSGRTDVDKLLLDEGANPEKGSEQEDNNPLYWAIFLSRRDMVRFLLDAGANPNSVCSLSGNYPLAGAAKYGQVDMVLDLLKAGADPNKTDIDGERTALDEATSYDRRSSPKVGKDMIKMLLDAGAHPTSTSTSVLYSNLMYM